MKKFKEFLKEKLAKETNRELVNYCSNQILEAYKHKQDLLVSDWKGFKVFAISGTKTLEDIKFDLTSGSVSFSEDEKDQKKIWTGFYKKMEHLFPSIEKEINIWKKEQDPSLERIVFTGHSLGASVAEILFLKFGSKGKLLVFGSPATGNKEFYQELFGGKNSEENVHYILQKNKKGELDPISKFPQAFAKDQQKFSDAVDYIETDDHSLLSLGLHSSEKYAKNVSKALGSLPLPNKD